MFVPVDLLKPILGELRARGLSRSSRRAWLGVNCAEQDGQVRVVRVSATARPRSPACGPATGSCASTARR